MDDLLEEVPEGRRPLRIRHSQAVSFSLYALLWAGSVLALTPPKGTNIMDDTKTQAPAIVAPWTEELADEQDAPRVPVLDCMIPIVGYMEVRTLKDVFDNFREGMILVESRTRGYFLVVPITR